MDERWTGRAKKLRDIVQQGTKPYVEQYIPHAARAKVETWNVNRKLAKLDFNDYQDDFVVSQEEFRNSREGLLNHVGQVLRGRGGRTEQEANGITNEWIDNLGQHFNVVASLMTSEDIHAYKASRNMAQFLSEDHEARRYGLMRLRGASHVYPANIHDMRNIAYSYGDPQKEWITDEAVANIVETMPRENAVELYKRIVREQVGNALRNSPANIHESTDSKAELKKAAILGAGAAAIFAAIFGGKK